MIPDKSHYFLSEQRNNRGIAMEELLCSNDGKKLGEVRDDYLDSPEEKNRYRNQGNALIKCPKCKEIIAF